MVLHGCSIKVLKRLRPNSVDSVVTDPPYGLSFMNKKWDYDVPTLELWREVLRVLKPGGHLLSFGGTRTYHRLACAIEDAGFEIRDQIQWIYGSGFPKSLDVSKAIDKAAGAEREVIGEHPNPAGNKAGGNSLNMSAVGMPETAFLTAPSTDAAKQWQGWGTALKPANEPIVLARKPLSEKTVAKNVLRWGVGALNIDASRIEAADQAALAKNWTERGTPAGFNGDVSGIYGKGKMSAAEAQTRAPQGRWPANVIFDEVTAVVLDEQVIDLGPQMREEKYNCGPSRFFYVAKASRKERNAGLEGMPEKKTPKMSGGSLQTYQTNGGVSTVTNTERSAQNHHPTVKPVKLMEYLCKLITPPGGTVLDPFCGSGSTGVAAKRLGFKFVGIEREKEYVKIAKRRITSPAARRTAAIR